MIPMKKLILSQSIASMLKNAAPKKPDASILRFECTPEDTRLIGAIVSRGVAMGKSVGITVDYMGVMMDITAVHCNHRPIKLMQLLMSDDGDFSHDFTLIGVAINRATGRLDESAKLRFWSDAN